MPNTKLRTRAAGNRGGSTGSSSIRLTTIEENQTLTEADIASPKQNARSPFFGVASQRWGCLFLLCCVLAFVELAINKQEIPSSTSFNISLRHGASVSYNFLDENIINSPSYSNSQDVDDNDDLDEKEQHQGRPVISPTMKETRNTSEASEEDGINEFIISYNTTLSGIEKIHALEAELESLSLRYYMYDDPRIVQANLTQDMLDGVGWQSVAVGEHMTREAKVEHLVLQAIEEHPLRTFDIEEADFFILPIRMGANLISNQTTWETIVEALKDQPTWNGGRNHVLINFMFLGARWVYGMERWWYDKMKHVTVVQTADMHELTRRTQAKDAAFQASDFAKNFAVCLTTQSKHGFSLGLLPNPSNLLLTKATRSKFENSTNFFFYRSRTGEDFWYNSTRYRRAPLDVAERLLQPSSIGHDLPKDEWYKQYSDSKYCLAIRGDTPHSHALLRSVRVGCIPVVVSDFFDTYAPTFKSTLNMQDYAIFVEEDEFIHHTAASLNNAVQSLTREQLEHKLEAMAFAQRVTATDANNSLFVPAFVKESWISMNKPAFKYSLYQ